MPLVNYWLCLLQGEQQVLNGDLSMDSLDIAYACSFETGRTTQTDTMYVENSRRREFEVSGMEEGLSSEEDMKLTAYPNPAYQSILLQANGWKDGRLLLSMTDMQGRLVLSSIVQLSSGGFTKTLDISSLKPGLYQISLFGNTRKSINIEIR